jgi:hypothetical protein
MRCDHTQWLHDRVLSKDRAGFRQLDPFRSERSFISRRFGDLGSEPDSRVKGCYRTIAYTAQICHALAHQLDPGHHRRTEAQDK